MTCKNDLKFKFRVHKQTILEHSHTHLFMFCLRLFSQYSSRIEYEYFGWQSLKYMCMALYKRIAHSSSRPKVISSGSLP